MSNGSADSPSYTAYVDMRWATLYRFAFLLAGDPDEAQDLLQATLVKAYVKWDRVTAAGSVDAYVRRMLLNELIGERRLLARRRTRAHLVNLVNLVEEEVALRTDPTERIDLWTHLRSLPPRQRAVLVLRYYEDLSEAEIAEHLGCSRGTVKSQAHDALRTLRARLDEDEEVAR